MQLIRLETAGRTTGLPHIVELRYAVLDGSFFVMSGRGKSDWALNALHGQKGTVRAGDLLYETKAERATDEEKAHALESYRRRYGRPFVDKWYADSQDCLRLTPVGTPVVRGASRGEQEVKSDFKEWSSGKGNYYDEIAVAFDSASNEYDFTINHNFINSWIRRRSIETLSRYLSPEDTVLEVGCGTGAEAIEVSKQVKSLIAIDISQRMIDLFRAKVRARGLTSRVIPMRLAASDLSGVVKHLDNGGVRVAYSFNGALNCEPRISKFVEQLHALLQPGGVFVCSVRNTLCLSEVASHAAALQFDRMVPRKKQPIMVSVGGREIPSYYYSPSRFIRFFTPYFKVEKVIALPGLLPPAYLNDYYLKLRALTSILERVDSAVAGRFPINRFGDQTLFVFRKVDART